MRRSLQFDALEQRVTMSVVLSLPAAGAMAARQLVVNGNLQGGESSIIPGTNDVVMGGFNGKLGKVQLQSTLYGQVSGNRLLDGSVHLFNSQGTILAELGPGKLVKSGKSEQLKVGMTFQTATGAYNQVEGSAGIVTILLTPGKSKAKAAMSVPLSEDWTTDHAVLKLFVDSGNELAHRVLLGLP